MNIKSKDVVILGIGRFQKDFEYMFPNINVVEYINLYTDNNKSYNSKKCYNINKISKESLINKLVIICERKDKKINEILNSLKLKENKDYIYMEDLAYLLDDNKDIFIDKVKYYNNIYIKRRKDYKSPYIKNSQLFKKMIYTDSYDSIECRFPFEYVNIQPNGEVYCCCESWGYHAIGNLFAKSPDEIWNKTYAFCDKTLCPYLSNSMQKTDTRFEDKKEEVMPQDIYVSIDRSCNLHCKSCRNEHFNAKGLKLK